MVHERTGVRATVETACLKKTRVSDRVRIVRSGVLGFLLLALLALTACSSQNTPTNVNGGGTGAAMQGNSGSTASGVSSGGGGPSGSASGSMSPTTAACDAYCTAITSNCTGMNAQYHDKTSCMTACKYLPAGAPGDTSGNSIACRTTVAMSAAGVTATPNSACWWGGPLGYGTCGEECDAFCMLATGYCSAAAGYTGAPVWASYGECYMTCQNFGRHTDFSADGGYTAAGVTGDTLECRAYHLIDNALQSPALQQVHCPHAGAASAACGPGPGVTNPDASAPPQATSDAGAPPVMEYDGGTNFINASNWNETIYPFSKRRMLLRDEGTPHVHLEDLGDPTKNWSSIADGDFARAMQLIGNNQVLGGRTDGYDVYDLTTGAIVKTVHGFAGTMSAYRMANGETMLTRSGCTLDFLGPDDKVKHSIAYPGHGYVRLGRPTRNGTFLVPNDLALFEGDANGKVLWTTTSAGWQHVWEPLLMASGDTLLFTAFGSTADVVDKVTHKVTKRYGGKAMPNAAMYNPNFFSESQILWNGNIIVSNWQGHGGGHGGTGIQVIEFDPAGNVVWSWKQDPARYSSIQAVMVIDGMDPKYLHVQETSTDSTWQPVH